MDTNTENTTNDCIHVVSFVTYKNDNLYTDIVSMWQNESDAKKHALAIVNSEMKAINDRHQSLSSDYCEGINCVGFPYISWEIWETVKRQTQKIIEIRITETVLPNE